jgi:hypothetical protein
MPDTFEGWVALLAFIAFVLIVACAAIATQLSDEEPP